MARGTLSPKPAFQMEPSTVFLARQRQDVAQRTSLPSDRISVSTRSFPAETVVGQAQLNGPVLRLPATGGLSNSVRQAPLHASSLGREDLVHRTFKGLSVSDRNLSEERLDAGITPEPSDRVQIAPVFRRNVVPSSASSLGVRGKAPVLTSPRHSSGDCTPGAGVVTRTGLLPIGDGQKAKFSSSFSKSPEATTPVATSPKAATPTAAISSSAHLEQLIERLTETLHRRERALIEVDIEKRQIASLLNAEVVTDDSKPQEEQEPAVVNEHPALELGPERPRPRRRPPFSWRASPDYESEFSVRGDYREVVTKTRDFVHKEWVVPVAGTWRLSRGAAYRWTLCIEHICPHRPQLQLGIHGLAHQKPWRLLATSRCSRVCDDGTWCGRPEGDRPIEEGDHVHLELDLRGLHLPFGTLSLAINSDPPDLVFDDIPLNTGPTMPVVLMGGDQSRVRLCPAY